MRFDFLNRDLAYERGRHYLPLEGLRGIAIALVLLYHCFPVLYKFGTGIGLIGVDLFLVISGFLITGILLNQKHKPRFFSDFFRNRSLRIFPLYFLFLGCFFFLFPLFWSGFKENYTFYIENKLWYFLYLPNWLIFFNGDWPPVSKPILDHFWLLAIEEQFYLVWPFVVYFSNNIKLFWFCVSLIVFSFFFRNFLVLNNFHYSSSYVNTFARLDPLASGALMAVVIRDEKLLVIFRKLIPFLFIFSLLVLLLLIVISKSVSLKTSLIIQFGYSSIAVMFMTILFMSLFNNTFLERFLKNKILLWLGKYSYGIYVLHWFLYPLLASDLIDLLNRYFHYTFISDFLTSVILTILILVLSLISFHLIEKHFTAMKRKISL
ncbi:MAG: acyltransferase [Cytophagales bacterium]